MAVYGDLLQVSCEHPELGSRVFKIKSAEDYPIQKGGFKHADDENNTTTDGERIYIVTRYSWMATVTVVPQSGDIDYLQDMVNTVIEGNWTYTHKNGEVRVGRGLPAGDLEKNFQSGTLPLTVKGSGTLESI